MAKDVTKVIISCAGQDDIVLEHSDLKLEVEFVVDTVQTKVKDRKNDIVNEITIRGLITPATTAEVKKLAEWSLSNDYKQQYRKVDIAYAANSSNKMVREFKLTKAFCVDYKEIYPSEISQRDSSSAREPYFEILLSQKADSLEDISVIAGSPE